MTFERSAILMYHSLDASGSPVSIPPDVFRAQMDWLASNARVVPLAEIRRTPGAVALTFDDAFRNFYDHALPVLIGHRFPATVFVVSDRCGGWNDWTQPRGIPRLALMAWSELETAAAAGVTLGAHTSTHPMLTTLDDGTLDREMAGSRAAIEDRTGRPVDTFAYPYGDSSAAVRRAAERHFRLACGTRLAYVSPESDVLELPRIDVYYLQNRRWFEALGRPAGAAYIAARRWGRAARAFLPG